MSLDRDAEHRLHWLDLHKADRYDWKWLNYSQGNGDRVVYRRQGIVENLFDADGILFEGRADLHNNLSIEIKTALNSKELREKIALVWTCMRLQHVLLACKSLHLNDIEGKDGKRFWSDKCFAYTWPRTFDEALRNAQSQMIFIEDFYPNVKHEQFYPHVMNSSRAIQENDSLSRLYVLPAEPNSAGTTKLRLIVVMAHQIVDGISSFRWGNDFSERFNYNMKELRGQIERLVEDQDALLGRLPPSQEALYPARSPRLARDRWHWVISRILRHVRKAPPAAFQNPLRRKQPLSQAQPMPPTYSSVLNYGKTPPLNAGYVSGGLSERATSNLVKMCKEAGISIGSGSFTIIAMVMMQLEERNNPNVPPEKRLPFVGSFPVNPRPFLAGKPTTGKEDSCMLAFSDGVTLPFLSSDLNFRGRFNLLGKQTHRQLRQYQKRKNDPREKLVLGSRSPSELLPALYLSTLERMEARALPEEKTGLWPQGDYPLRPSPTGATCGISSVGSLAGLTSEGKYDVHAPLNGREMVADFRGIGGTVRPRDGEFLVGAVGEKGRQNFLVAFDANAIDPAKANEWKQLLESILDHDMHPVTSTSSTKGSLIKSEKAPIMPMPPIKGKL